jgi:2-acylglycerol O-acyltransferase 2
MPCYVFGEERTYWQTQIGSLKFRFWLNKYNIPTIAFIGKFGILPDNNIDVTMVVGKKFDLPKISDPSEADINKYHQEYIEKIQALFDKHKRKYAYTGEEAKLEIF